MEDINLKPAIAIVIVSGICFYFLNAVWAMYYTAELPLQNEFCTRWAAEQTGSSEGKMFCDEYANEFEKLKHLENLDAEARILPRKPLPWISRPGYRRYCLLRRRPPSHRETEG